MRLAARSTVTLRHTYNLVDMPVKVAGKSGTAEFGTRDSKGRLPFHSWFVGFVPKNPYKADFTKPDSQLVFLAFAYDSRTKGNAGTEIAKAFLQLPLPHQEGLPQPRPPAARQLLPEQLGGHHRMRVMRAEPGRFADMTTRSVGAGRARLRPAAHDVRRAARARLAW